MNKMSKVEREIDGRRDGQAARSAGTVTKPQALA